MPLTSALLLEHCDAVILAGGKATRLQGTVDDRPKFLAPVGGRPFAHFLLDQLVQAGFQRAIICTGHLADMIEQALGTDWKGMSLVYSREHEALDTGGALRLALPKIAGSHAVVINGDTFVRLDFGALLARFGESGAAAALCAVEVDDARRFGTVLLDECGFVLGFTEKNPDLPVGGRYLINAGVYLLPRSAIAAIDAGRRVSLEKELMAHWVQSGLLAFRSDGPFIDIGTPDSFREAQAVLERWAAPS